MTLNVKLTLVAQLSLMLPV